MKKSIERKGFYITLQAKVSEAGCIKFEGGGYNSIV